MGRGPQRARRESIPGTVFPSEAVARNVRAYRGLRRLTQSELAERMAAMGLEWSAGTVGFVERYERSVTVDEYVSLTLCLGVRVGALLDPTGPLGSDPVGLQVGDSAHPEASLSFHGAQVWTRGDVALEFGAEGAVYSLSELEFGKREDVE